MATQKFTHVMVDLETGGNVPGCTILSIGAVQFNPMTGKLGAEHYEVVNHKSCMDYGLFDNQSTINWWKNQSKEARSVLTLSMRKTKNTPLPKALLNFQDFLCATTSFDNIKVWGCGSDFDNAILSAAYNAVETDLPWLFWNNRCYRTMKTLAPSIKVVRQGTYHNALDDAKTQAIHLAQVVQHLNLQM